MLAVTHSGVPRRRHADAAAAGELEKTIGYQAIAETCSFVR